MPNLVEDSSVLLNIVDFLDIPTILDLRRTCKSIHKLISRYEYSIAQTLKACAWHEKVDDEIKYLAVSSLCDLVRLNIARQLAIKLVASRQLLRFFDDSYCAGIAPYDPLGHELRDYVTRGFMLVYAFHRLRVGLGCNKPDAISKLFESIRGMLKGKPARYQTAEVTMLQNEWSQYTSSLAAIDFVALSLVSKVMIGKMLYDGRVTESCGGSPLWINVKASDELPAVKWLASFILLQGPAFVKRFWSDDQNTRNAAYLSLETACKKRTANMVALERRAFCPMFGVGFTAMSPASISQSRDISKEAWSYYISVFKIRRGPLPATVPWEDQIRIRQQDSWQWSMSCSGWLLAGIIPKNKWKKGTYRNRVKPVVSRDQESQDLP